MAIFDQNGISLYHFENQAVILEYSGDLITKFNSKALQIEYSLSFFYDKWKKMSNLFLSSNSSFLFENIKRLDVIVT
ncbi:hypothetical protein BpHYR1_027589 [Brachionus plicatilis]|uniref:Uncharacterized protein n=1 Tax=Brachionus plicatilis TaxID=10195 RepID=A0A3M7PI86_BRAPC|nr:hypothetical protein BpHYR1_027589 [Brachionus plicatilis]